jgi:hypothetical protein
MCSTKACSWQHRCVTHWVCQLAGLGANVAPLACQPRTTPLASCVDRHFCGVLQEENDSLRQLLEEALAGNQQQRASHADIVGQLESSHRQALAAKEVLAAAERKNQLQEITRVGACQHYITDA